MNKGEAAVFVAFAIIFAIGLLIGMTIVDRFGEQGWISNWQALIAGMLAVVAAGWTVFEMRRTDERQQDRHDQLVKLNLRADKLAVSRAAFVHTVFRSVAEDSAKLNNTMQTDFAGHDTQSRRPSAEMLAAVFSIYERIDKGLALTPISEASRLFGPMMITNYELLLNERRRMEIYMDQITSHRGNVTPGAARSLRDLVPQIVGRFMYIQGPMEEFADQLIELKDSYE